MEDLLSRWLTTKLTCWCGLWLEAHVGLGTEGFCSSPWAAGLAHSMVVGLQDKCPKKATWKNMVFSCWRLRSHINVISVVLYWSRQSQRSPHIREAGNLTPLEWKAFDGRMTKFQKTMWDGSYCCSFFGKFNLHRGCWSCQYGSGGALDSRGGCREDGEE